MLNQPDPPTKKLNTPAFILPEKSNNIMSRGIISFTSLDVKKKLNLWKS